MSSRWRYTASQRSIESEIMVRMGDTGIESDRVSQAAAELGISVPNGFRLLPVGEDGEHVAMFHGDASQTRASAAILGRLDGKSVSECLVTMTNAELVLEPKPEWWPPDDLTDPEALLAYLAKLDEHPEWPRIYNGPIDWVAVATVAAAGAGVATVAMRMATYVYIVEQAKKQGVTIDPVALIQAIEGKGSTPTSDPNDSRDGQIEPDDSTA